ncbi:MAG TPA: GAF domain-containing protein [Terriglobales bacterium]|nr:GAF domain-containing protein [Terriglobales bacterium]
MPLKTEFDLIRDMKSAARSAPTVNVLMATICHTLQHRLYGYDWVGFYLLDPQDPNYLVLGPFVGAQTPHTRIPLNEGICGAAVSQGETIVVDDVNSDPRYLACSLETKSEIVVPIKVHGKIVGEIDIDSHDPARFKDDDRKMVESIVEIVGQYMEQHAPAAKA